MIMIPEATNPLAIAPQAFVDLLVRQQNLDVLGKTADLNEFPFGSRASGFGRRTPRRAR
jgi:hypothetical protein